MPELNFIPLHHFSGKPMNSFNPKRLKWRTICDTAVLHQADTWGGESRLTKLTLGKGGIMTRTFTCATSSGKIRAVEKKGATCKGKWADSCVACLCFILLQVKSPHFGYFTRPKFWALHVINHFIHMPKLLLEWEITRHSTECWWKMSLCFLGILEQKQGLALVPLMVPCPSFLSGNPADLRVAQASAGRTLTADKLPPFCQFFPFPRPFHFQFTAQPKKPHVLQKHIVWFFYGLKKTESLHSSKPPEGPGCYCMGDLYYSGSETSQPQISTFFEEMQLSSERKKNSLLLKDKVISSVLRANFSSQISMTDCISGWEQLRHMGNGMGSCFPCSASVTLQGWC